MAVRSPGDAYRNGVPVSVLQVRFLNPFLLTRLSELRFLAPFFLEKVDLLFLPLILARLQKIQSSEARRSDCAVVGIPRRPP